MSDVERRERLAFAIRAAMGKRTAQDVADAMDPKRSKETVARWARGETVPSALDIGPLAVALGVRPILLIEPPPVPVYPIDEYRLTATDSELADFMRALTSPSMVAELHAAYESGGEEGFRRAAERLAELDPVQPAPSPARRPRGTAAGRG